MEFGMIEIRSAEGRLLCKVTEDFSAIEIVQRRRRYLVHRAQVGVLHAVVVSYVEVEKHEELEERTVENER
jgi:hypothetical protein